MLQNLERRLDNTVYRAGFGSPARRQRQLVAHAHIKVNGTVTKTPSYQ
jgi:small subunit ribosomal protein S4